MEKFAFYRKIKIQKVKDETCKHRPYIARFSFSKEKNYNNNKKEK